MARPSRRPLLLRGGVSSGLQPLLGEPCAPLEFRTSGAEPFVGSPIRFSICAAGRSSSSAPVTLAQWPGLGRRPPGQSHSLSRRTWFASAPRALRQLCFSTTALRTRGSASSGLAVARLPSRPRSTPGAPPHARAGGSHPCSAVGVQFRGPPSSGIRLRASAFELEALRPELSYDRRSRGTRPGRSHSVALPIRRPLLLR